MASIVTMRQAPRAPIGLIRSSETSLSLWELHPRSLGSAVLLRWKGSVLWLRRVDHPAPYGFKVFVPAEIWIAPIFTLTKFTPGHDARIEVNSNSSNPSSVNVQMEFLDLIDYDRVAQSVNFTLASSFRSFSELRLGSMPDDLKHPAASNKSSQREGKRKGEGTRIRRPFRRCHRRGPVAQPHSPINLTRRALGRRATTCYQCQQGKRERGRRTGSKAVEKVSLSTCSSQARLPILMAFALEPAGSCSLRHPLGLSIQEPPCDIKGKKLTLLEAPSDEDRSATSSSTPKRPRTATSAYSLRSCLSLPLTVLLEPPKKTRYVL